MPTINVKRDSLFTALGKQYTDDEFADLCFDYGLELDEITTEKQMIAKEQGSEKSSGAAEDVIYRIDIPANRYDLLCVEGLVRGLQIFLQRIDVPQYRLSEPKEIQKLIVLPSTILVRPYAVGAVLRNISFTKERYDSFIELQDKLHQNLCRKRSLVSIGTHDLNTVTGPFYYDAREPKDIRFRALNHQTTQSADEMMEMFSGDSHLKPYVPIIKDKPVYPVIYDSKQVVLSLPPITNSEHSKIKLTTTNVFIEVTATDLHKARLVLDTLICMFSEYCAEKFTVEPIEVISSGSVQRYPDLKYRRETISVEKVNKLLGTNIKPGDMCKLLTRMSLKSELVSGNHPQIDVVIPPTRQDILHACDIAEDVGVAFGFNNIENTLPNAVTIGKQLTMSKITDQLRFEISRCGYTEALTFSLCSREDIADNLRKPEKISEAVLISNPKTFEFQVARTTLIPGLLKTIQANKRMPLPLKLFEISDIVLKDPAKDVGAKNERRLCILKYNKTPGFEAIHGLLDRVMQVMEIPYVGDKGDKQQGYFIQSCEDNTFLKGRCAKIVSRGKDVGVMGVLHPDVLTKFELNMPCALLELDIELLSHNSVS